MDQTQTLAERVPQQFQPMSEVHVVWQYKDYPEQAHRVYQFLGVFSTLELAVQRTAERMRGSDWTVEISQAQLDPDNVCLYRGWRRDAGSGTGAENRRSEGLAVVGGPGRA